MNKSLDVTNPVSTSGAGYSYEDHIGAMFLGLLLVRGIPAVFKDCQIDEVSFQTEYLGWNTDDLLVSCTSDRFARRQLAVQVKRSFRMSASDRQKVFTDFWNDFNSPERFDPTSDALILATRPGPQTLMDGLGGLLECARNSSDETDFARRLTTPQFLTKKAREYSQTIRSIVEQIEPESSVTDWDFWRFLKSIYILTLDFTTSTSQQEAWTKQILAMASTTNDGAAKAAEKTWLELLRLTQESRAGAKSWRYDGLPGPMRESYFAIEAPRGNLQHLLDRSEITQQAIRITFDNTVFLDRLDPLTQVAEALAESKVVAVTGPAGSGKSVLAKAAMLKYAENHECISFRAEEFAKSHIDDVLQPPFTGKQIETLLGAQERVLLHVESLERLLEHSTRDAFTDLVGIAERCHNVRILLTCREHSVDTVANSFFGLSVLTPSVVAVPPLRDDELEKIEESLPQLSVPLSDPALRELLRTPYLLEMATKLDWGTAQELPSGTAAFRQKFWCEVVRRDSYPKSALPSRREKALVELSLRRARQLRAFVPVHHIDNEALEVLRADDIVSMDPNGLAAPVHDVIEDWAIIRWIEFLMETHEWQAPRIAKEIGSYPALRRGFREWLRGALDGNVLRADDFVLSAYRDNSLEAYFRDDVLIAMLLANSSQDFLARQKMHLLSKNGEMLSRIIHLMRVACKRFPEWADDETLISSTYLQPEGDSWRAVFEIIAENIDSLLPNLTGLIMGMLEDWSQGVRGSTQPPGWNVAGRIAFRLLEDMDGYSHQDLRTRALHVIAKAPDAEPREFVKLISRASSKTNRRDPVLEDFSDLLLNEMDGIEACQHFPEEMRKLMLSRCLMTDADLEHAKEYPAILPDTNVDFGIRDMSTFEYNNPSALRGPFLPLLNHHPRIGLKLILEILNHSGGWYGNRKWTRSTLEPATRISLPLADNGESVQWFNERLWIAYRGISVVPPVLQCALMALEYWLLQMEGHDTLDDLLMFILRSSNNVMMTSVVASVCNAYPENCRGAALSLLASRELIEIDLGRLVKEYRSRLTTGIGFGPAAMTYSRERSESNAKEHRKHSLETLAVKLQFGETRDDVLQVIDDHLKTMPDESERNLDDQTWLLALHRMDTRGFEAIPIPPGSDDGKSEADAYVKFELSLDVESMDDDLQKLVGHGDVQARQVDKALSVISWTNRRLDQDSEQEGFVSWNEALSLAREPLPDDEHVRFAFHELPQRVAAVCITDHWEDMDVEDRDWCVQTLIRELEIASEHEDMVETIPGEPFTGNIMRPNGLAAYTLPRILVSEQDNSTLLEALSTSVTHSSEQVAFNAAQGVVEYLKSTSPDLLLQCAGAIAMRASLLNECSDGWNISRNQPSVTPDRRSVILKKLELISSRIIDLIRSRSSEAKQDIGSKSALVRHRFLRGEIDVEPELTRLDLNSWYGMVAVRPIMVILSGLPSLPISQFFFKRVAKSIIQRSKGDHNSVTSIRIERDATNRLAEFILRLPIQEATLCCQPILEAVYDRPEKVADFVESLILMEDQAHPRATCFWGIWAEVARRMLDSPWLSQVNNSRSNGADLLKKILLDIHWRDDLHHWRRADGHEHDVGKLVSDLPATSPVLESYARYLYRIGERSFPHSFTVVETVLRTSERHVSLLGSSDTVFCLEMVLQRYVYAEPRRLKEDPTLRSAVMLILDELVDAGSSVAYRMRDDFVTPADILH